MLNYLGKHKKPIHSSSYIHQSSVGIKISCSYCRGNIGLDPIFKIDQHVMYSSRFFNSVERNYIITQR